MCLQCDDHGDDGGSGGVGDGCMCSHVYGYRYMGVIIHVETQDQCCFP